MINIELFNGKNVRKVLHDGEWHYSLTDVVGVLRKTPYQLAQQYCHVFLNRLKKDGETIPDLQKLKVKSADGKKYLTYVTTLKGVEFISTY